MTITSEDIIEDMHNEFKLILNETLEKEAIAFLNTKGGNIYIGVDDKGKPVGLDENIDELQLKIKNRLLDKISPSILGLFEIIVESEDGVKYLKVTFAEGSEKPYYLSKKGMNSEGCFYRIGSAVQKMNERQINELVSEKEPDLKEKEAPTQDLHFEQLKIYYEAAGRDYFPSNFFNSLELFTSEGKYNYFAYLLSDHNNISVRFAKYAGNDHTEMINYEEYGCVSLVKACKAVLDRIKIENRAYSGKKEGERKENRPLNYSAVSEAVVNAIIHTDYSKEDGPQFEWFSDRLVITSYGEPPKGALSDGFFSGVSHPKWRVLMRVFTDLHLSEHIGNGIHTILEHYDKSIFEITSSYVRVSFPFNSETNIDSLSSANAFTLTPISQSILSLLEKNPYMRQEEIAKELDVNSKRVKRYFTTLKENGYITHYGSNKSGYWKVNKKS